MNWQRIKFKCKNCGNESWMEVNLDNYLIEESDLLCDDCIPVEEE